MKTYVNFAVLTVLIVGSLVWLAMGGIADTKTYYKQISELRAMGSSAHNTRLRVGGNVRPGSIVRHGSQASFALHQGPEILNVVYTGIDPLPDTFKDNAEALADGRLGPDGVFEANKIQAKCASKYEAKPPAGGAMHQTSKPVATSARLGS